MPGRKDAILCRVTFGKETKEAALMQALGGGDTWQVYVENFLIGVINQSDYHWHMAQNFTVGHRFYMTIPERKKLLSYLPPPPKYSNFPHFVSPWGVPL